MKDHTRHTLVGLTAIVGLVGVGTMMLLFGYAPAWLEEGYRIRVYLDNASGLLPDSRVKLSGIDIGRITHVALRDSPHRGIVVTALIREGVRIPEQSEVMVESPLIGGSPKLAFNFDHLDPAQPLVMLPTDGRAEIKGLSLTLVSQFAGELEAAIDGPTRQFGQMVEHFNRLANQWSSVAVNINQLIEQRSADDVDSAKAMGNLTTVLARTDQRLAELRGVIQGFNDWVNDPRLKENVMMATANARSLTEKLNVSADRVDRLLQTADESVGGLAKRYLAVADDLSGTIASVRKATDLASTDQGTVGKLLNDPALYHNLNDSAQRLQVVLEELQLLLAKWKEEGLPVQF